MLGKLVSFKTKDKLVLDGFYIPKKSKKGAIFIHGLTSRVRLTVLVDALINSVPKLDYHFLSFNNRGFGVINYFKPDKKKARQRYIGGALERFEDCRLDLQAAVNFLKKQGCRRIILIGHSTGTQKSAYYLTKRPDRAVKGVVLLAPANDTEGDIAEIGRKKFQVKFNKAKQMVKKGELGKILKVVVEYFQGWVPFRLQAKGQDSKTWKFDPEVSGKSLTIADIGIHAENLNHIFDPFYHQRSRRRDGPWIIHCLWHCKKSRWTYRGYK